VSTPPFQPLGAVSRAQVIYEELLSAAKPGDIITYEALGTLLGIDHADPAGRIRIRSPLHQATRKLLKERGHAVVAVTNVGYRIAEPAEHLEIAKGHQRRATRQIKMGHAVVTHVDLSEQPEEVQTAFGVVAAAFAQQGEINRRTAGVMKRQEESLAAVTVRVDRTEDEVAELRKRLAALEQQKPS
jgi:hypothetical protein